MSKGREYEPIMCNRKLKKLTKITENNLGTAMHHINKFLSKPTKILRGFVPEILGFESVYDECTGSFLGERTIYSEKSYPNYQSYEGQCVYHQFWLDYKKGTRFGSTWDFKDLPRLAIVSKYATNCIPVTVGDAYKVYGNRLVILHKWDKYVNNTKWLRYSEFIHVSDDQSMTNEEKISACANIMVNELTDSFINYEFSDYNLNSCVRGIAELFPKIILDKFRSDKEASSINLSLPVYNQHSVEVTVFPKVILNSSDCSPYFSIKDSKTRESYADMYEAVVSILKPYDTSYEDIDCNDFDDIDEYYFSCGSDFYDDYSDED